MRALALWSLLILPLAARAASPDSTGSEVHFGPGRDLLLHEGTTAQAPADSTDAGMVQFSGFAIDVYEYPNQAGVLPTTSITLAEARALCQTRGKRLCAESEWEQACRGQRDFPYGYGPQFEPERCNTPFPEGDQWKRRQGPAASGVFADCSTPEGVHDLVGNVWEWTEGWYNAQRGWAVVRGGSWFHNANYARADGRYGPFLSPEYRLDLIGFRCCR